MKKIILIGLLVLIAVMITGAEQQTYRTLTISAPIPDRYIDAINSSNIVINVYKEDIYTHILINITGLTNAEINAIRSQYTRLSQHFESLYNSNLVGVAYFQSEQLPFACPKDVITGQISGLYLVNGVIEVDAGDLAERCP